MKLGIRVNTGKATTWEAMEKALTHKYIRRIPKKTGKGYNYIYAETYKKPWTALKEFFGIGKEKIEKDYESNKIKEQYGADKPTFAAHILEYFSNKFKWDKLFSNREERKKAEKPVKIKEPAVKVEKKPGGSAKQVGADDKPAFSINRSLMQKVWKLYNPQAARLEEAKDAREAKIEHEGLPVDANSIRAGEDKGHGDSGATAPGAASNNREPLRDDKQYGDSSGRSGRGRDIRSTITPADARAIIAGEKFIPEGSYIAVHADKNEQLGDKSILLYEDMQAYLREYNRLSYSKDKQGKDQRKVELVIPNGKIWDFASENSDDFIKVAENINAAMQDLMVGKKFPIGYGPAFQALGKLQREIYKLPNIGRDEVLSESKIREYLEMVLVYNTAPSNIDYRFLDLYDYKNPDAVLREKPVLIKRYGKNLLALSGAEEYANTIDLTELSKIKDSSFENLAGIIAGVRPIPENSVIKIVDRHGRTNYRDNIEDAKKVAAIDSEISLVVLEDGKHVYDFSSKDTEDYRKLYTSIATAIDYYNAYGDKELYNMGYTYPEILELQRAIKEAKAYAGGRKLTKEGINWAIEKIYFTNSAYRNQADLGFIGFTEALNEGSHEAHENKRKELMPKYIKTSDGIIAKVTTGETGQDIPETELDMSEVRQQIEPVKSAKLRFMHPRDIPTMELRNKLQDALLDVFQGENKDAAIALILEPMIDKLGQKREEIKSELKGKHNQAERIESETKRQAFYVVTDLIEEAVKNKDNNFLQLHAALINYDGPDTKYSDLQAKAPEVETNIPADADYMSEDEFEASRAMTEEDKRRLAEYNESKPMTEEDKQRLRQYEGKEKEADFTKPENDAPRQPEPQILEAPQTTRTPRSKKEIKEVRQEIMGLLASKQDHEMTAEDKELLKLYEGQGGLQEEGSTVHGALYEFYTPQKVVNKVWQLVDKYMPSQDKKVLEPSAGTGRFAEGRSEKFTLVELDETSARIAGILYPEAELKQGAFQELFMEGRQVKKDYKGPKYDVSIGNPPYGRYSGFHAGLGEGKGHSRIEEYFIDRSLDALNDGGIVAMVLPSSFLRSPANKGKRMIAEKGEILEAWRMPNGTFGTTDVGTDIVLIRKGKGDITQFCNNAYFAENEDKIVGVEKTKTGRYGKEEAYIAPPDGMTFDEALDKIDVEKVKPVKETVIKPEIEEDTPVLTPEQKKAFEELNEKNKIRVMPLTVKDARLKGIIEDIKAGKSQTELEETAGKDIELKKKIEILVGVEREKEPKKRDVWDRAKEALERGELPDKVHEVAQEELLGLESGTKTRQNQSHKEANEARRKENLRLAMLGNRNAEGKHDVAPGPGEAPKAKGKKPKAADAFKRSIGKNMSGADFAALYGFDIDKDAVKIRQAARHDGSIDIAKLEPRYKEIVQKSGKYTFDGDVWIDRNLYASGNIYDKLDELGARLASGRVDQELYEQNKAILEEALPAKKPMQEIKISPISDFVKLFIVGVEEARYGDDKELTLIDKFWDWSGLRNYRGSGNVSDYEIPDGIRKGDVIDFINQKPARMDTYLSRTDKSAAVAELDRRKKLRKETAEKLFTRFLNEGLDDELKARVVDRWNRKFNGSRNADYKLIPVQVEGMNTHKGDKEFKLQDKQIEGISFLCTKGNGILGHEVGVGKTVSGIVANVHQIQSGKAKKPLICVPKAVYNKWIHEIQQHFPDMKVNDLGNLSDKDIARYKKDGVFQVEAGTISVCTYEALNNMTFKDETINDELLTDILDSQTIYDEEESERDKAQKKEDILAKLGTAAKAKGQEFLFWEDTGFDNITVDEVHNFKNVFGAARVSNPREGQTANEYAGLTGGTSNRALKMFAISQLIQRENNGTNVFGLSATPFNNSPIEVYNILSLVAREKLKELDIFNMHEFLTQFAELKSEWAVKPNGAVEQKQVMKNWSNLGALQNLLREYIDYVSADEAGVVRPKKTTHEVQLELTNAQKAIMDHQVEYMTYAKADDLGATLKAINAMRMATLSPVLVSDEIKKEIVDNGYATADELAVEKIVESSPKLKFVCDSIIAAYKNDQTSGQVMYVPRGVEQYKHIKKYFTDRGVPASAIEFMNSATTLNDKERIKASFNDDNGDCKIIIGSETIKEGVSFNKNAHSIYNCMLGWNPTEPVQVEGRSWRQGNRQGNVHVVYPLMADSIDSLMYQKYDEKASRIGALWNYKGETLDASDIDPAELKFDLIKDPDRRAEMKIAQEREKISNEFRAAMGKVEIIEKKSIEHENWKQRADIAIKRVKELEEVVTVRREAIKEAKENIKTLIKNKSPASEIGSAKNSLEQDEKNYKYYQEELSEARGDVNDYNRKADAALRVMARYGVDMVNIEAKTAEFKAEADAISKQAADLEAKKQEYIAEAREAIMKERIRLPSAEEQTKIMVERIGGDIYPAEWYKEKMAKMGKSFRLAVKVYRPVEVNWRQGIKKYLGG